MLTNRILQALNPRRARCAEEQGSVVVVVVIVVTLSVSIITLLATVQSNLGSARDDQDRTAAFQRANGGIDHALYRFDRADLPTSAIGSYTPVVANGKVVSFVETVTADGGNYTVTAVADPPGQATRYRVTSIGTDRSGRRRQAVATIAANPLFIDGFFTLLDFTLTGNQDNPIAYDSSVNPNPTLSALPTPIDGSLGTNGVIDGSRATIRAFAERWGRFNMYGRSTQAAADEACADGVCSAEGGTVRPFTDQRLIEMPPVPATAASCPNGGILTGVIQPGDYTCPVVVFQGSVTIGTGGNGSGVVRLWPTSRLRFTSGTVINQLQVPSKLQIYYPEPSDQASNDSTICGAEVWALLYTPGLNIACNGSHQPKMYGAVVARLHAGTGNHFDFHWDVQSSNAVNNGKFRVLNWRECPVGSTC